MPPAFLFPTPRHCSPSPPPASSLNPLFLNYFLFPLFSLSWLAMHGLLPCALSLPHLVRYQLLLPPCLSHSSFHDSIAAYLAQVI